MPHRETDQQFESWAVLELMGHRRLGGYVQEVDLAGAAFLRIDIPDVDGKPLATQFYGASAIYSLTPTTEEIARAVAARNQPQPVHLYELPTRTTVRPGTPDDVGVGYFEAHADDDN